MAFDFNCENVIDIKGLWHIYQPMGQVAQRIHLPDVEPPRGVGDGGGADLDDDAHGSVLLPLVSGMEYSTCAGR